MCVLYVTYRLTPLKLDWFKISLFICTMQLNTKNFHIVLFISKSYTKVLPNSFFLFFFFDCLLLLEFYCIRWTGPVFWMFLPNLFLIHLSDFELDPSLAWMSYRTVRTRLFVCGSVHAKKNVELFWGRVFGSAWNKIYNVLWSIRLFFDVLISLPLS